MEKLRPLQFFATLLFNQPGLTARKLRDAYLRYSDRDPDAVKWDKFKRWDRVNGDTAGWTKIWRGYYSDYFYTSYNKWNSKQLNRYWRATNHEKGPRTYTLMPQGYTKVALGLLGHPPDLTQYLSVQLELPMDLPKRGCPENVKTK
jgi:hypothetical protein